MTYHSKSASDYNELLNAVVDMNDQYDSEYGFTGNDSEVQGDLDLLYEALLAGDGDGALSAATTMQEKIDGGVYPSYFTEPLNAVYDSLYLSRAAGRKRASASKTAMMDVTPTAEKIMDISVSVWSENGWQDGGDVDIPTLASALEGVPFVPTDIAILEDYNFHASIEALEYLAADSEGRAYLAERGYYRYASKTAGKKRKPCRTASRHFTDGERDQIENEGVGKRARNFDRLSADVGDEDLFM